MKRYRTICIESDSETAIQYQIDKSLATGIHAGPHLKITAGRWREDDPNESKYFKDLSDHGLGGCITKQQLEEYNEKQLEKIDQDNG